MQSIVGDLKRENISIDGKSMRGSRGGRFQKATHIVSAYAGSHNLVLGQVDWQKINDPSPSGWRLPTFEEIDKLLEIIKVSTEWGTQNNVAGMKFTDKTNGASIFLPVVSGRYGADGSFNINSSGSYGFYWRGTGGNGSLRYLLGFEKNRGSYGYR